MHRGKRNLAPEKETSQLTPKMTRKPRPSSAGKVRLRRSEVSTPTQNQPHLAPPVVSPAFSFSQAIMQFERRVVLKFLDVVIIKILYSHIHILDVPGCPWLICPKVWPRPISITFNTRSNFLLIGPTWLYRQLGISSLATYNFLTMGLFRYFE